MPSAWDDRADKHLLLAIIDEGALKSISWQNVSDALNQKGYTFTREACRQHFQKLRRESRGNRANTTPTQPSKGTPTKRGTGSSTGKSKAQFASNDRNEDDDEEPYPPTPTYQNYSFASTPASKKRKVEKMEEEEPRDLVYGGQNAAIFKLEDAEDSGVVDLERDDLYSGFDYA
ncbi:hypothetical protein BP5796_01102 [Coleophoma crateriformis]|uniref:Myb-like domain-containing protein n=1 Tax=Coleophoma crateriformis TaxID=565419 RepID=A0A3D8T9T7_9HELO|nr:hypothetical protein BP5796_01102 [Coleophoma crateriformis]